MAGNNGITTCPNGLLGCYQSMNFDADNEKALFPRGIRLFESSDLNPAE
jgi:hypothetical protein